MWRVSDTEQTCGEKRRHSPLMVAYILGPGIINSMFWRKKNQTGRVKQKVMFLVNSLFITKSLYFSLSTPTCFRHTSLSQTGGHGVFEFKISGRNRIKRKNGFTQMCIGNQAHHQYSLAQNRTKPKENVEWEIINGSHK